MFSGRPRRNVNLGSKRQVSKQDVLKNAEIQRQLREQQRREIHAARSLQNRWRAMKLLDAARLQLAAEFVAHMKDADEFAYILPVINQLRREEQHSIVSRFADSPLSYNFHPEIVERLVCLWSLNDPLLHQQGYRVLRHQASYNEAHKNYTIRPSTIVKYFLSGNLEHGIAQFLLSSNPEGGLGAVLTLLAKYPGSNAASFSIDTLRPLFSQGALPKDLKLPKEQLENALYALLRMLAPATKDAPQLISTVVTNLSPRNSHPIDDIIPKLCSSDIFSELFQRSPEQAASYIIALKMHSPTKVTFVLQQLALSLSASSIWKAYCEVKTETLFHLALESFSFLLLVSTDSELGTVMDDIKELTQIVRDRCFNLLWNHLPNETVYLTGLNITLLKLLRQIYTRDSRMKIFPDGYWIPSVPIPHLLQSIDDSSFGSSADDDEDGIYGDTNGHGTPIDGTELKEEPLVLCASPSARILQHAPFFVPFETRAALFYKFIEKDRSYAPQYHHFAREEYDIHRETLLEDSESVFTQLNSQVKSNLFVRMWSDGQQEAGIDGGGLTRELLISICSEVFNKKEEDGRHTDSLFVETENHLLTPNPIYGESHRLMTDSIRSKYYFLGLVIGKCLYENLLVDMEFSPTFLSKWTSSTSTLDPQKSSFDELSLLDPQLYRSVSSLYRMDAKQVESLGLDFTLVNSLREVVELKPHGSTIPVTEANKLEYTWKVANYKLNVSFRPQTSWFLNGLCQIISLKWLNMFNPSELNKLISGESRDIDIEDLRKHTQTYGFRPNSPTLRNLWDLLGEFSPEQRAKFMKFVTSVPKGPLLGFVRLNPQFGIRCAGDSDQRLPTASTCFNLLKLPEYSSYQLLKEKLLYSIEAAAGFELS